MKLYAINSNSQKIYLNLTAFSRSELQARIGGSRFSLGEDVFDVQNVYAEKDSNRTTTGAVVGGAVGTLGGPFGILIGGLLGGLIGNGSDKEEDAIVERFNKS